MKNRPVLMLMFAAIASLTLGAAAAQAQPQLICGYPNHLCGRICIPKNKVCPHCPKGWYLCNGRCAPDRIGCILPVP